MAETDKAVPAIPADLRGKEKAIPAGYLHKSKETAGIAGIKTNPETCGRKVTHVTCVFLARAGNRECWLLSPLSPQSSFFQILNLRG